MLLEENTDKYLSDRKCREWYLKTMFSDLVKCRFFLTQPLTYWGLRRPGCGPPTLGRAARCAHSTDLDVNLIQQHLTDTGVRHHAEPSIWAPMAQASRHTAGAITVAVPLLSPFPSCSSNTLRAWETPLYLSPSLRFTPASWPVPSCWEVSLWGLVALAPLWVLNPTRVLHLSLPQGRKGTGFY